ncbi:Translocation protein S62 [Rhizophlyctis rosea]|uniref:Translocation protein SEC62 n=1 Tax=Rhizophlyctis rosea TaxID=64517 RepID=A0AAD5S811_9FUNG|nr:Translocation protein S62 [Rhizophlyctis rosea]
MAAGCCDDHGEGQQLIAPMQDASKVPRDLKAAADYLISGDSQLKIRPGVLSGRRVDFFKGKHAVNAFLRENYKRQPLVPPVPDRAAGETLCTTLNRHGFFLKVDKQPKQKTLTLVQQQSFEPESYYAWTYEVNTTKNTIIGTAVIAVVFAGVLFPLWPMFMRTGVYYLSLGLLGVMGVFMAMCVFRLVLWLGLKITTGRDGWLFPNLFADVGVVESFIPTWGWDDKKKKKSKKAVGAAGSEKAVASGSGAEASAASAVSSKDD